MPSLLVHELVAVAAVLVLYLLAFPGRRERKLPPGPPTLPLIGNLHQIPSTGAHFKFTEWAQQYGGIFSLKIGPSTVVVVSDRTLVKQLVDKKASIYSDRPTSYVTNDLITHGDHLLAMKYGEKWRLFRRLIHEKFREQLCERKHVKLVEAEATQMCQDFLVNPEGLMYHPKRFSNSIIMSLLFGVRTPSIRNKNMQAFYEMMEEWSQVMETGATPPVDIIPALKYLPEGLFNNWKSRCLHVGRSMTKLYSRMVTHVKARHSKLGSQGSFMDSLLDQQDKLQLNTNEQNFLAGVLMEGGSDTSASILLAFINAMVAHPHVQAKAHAELDRVVGAHRSPTWADFKQLPYISMIVKETMRWRPVTPLAFPHATTASDTVGSYHIPAGTTVILNVWGLHHLSDQCPPAPAGFTQSPSAFVPERYAVHALTLASVLASAPMARDRDHYGYGAGRRLCPGIHLAERNLWVAVAKLLWAFQWIPEVGRTVADVDVEPKSAYSEGFLVCKKAFGAQVLVRGEKRKEVLQRDWEGMQEIFGGMEEMGE